MSSYMKGGPLSRRTSESSATVCESPTQQRRQTWATATWTTGQNLITGMLYHRKDSQASQQQLEQHHAQHARHAQYAQQYDSRFRQQQHNGTSPTLLPPPDLEERTPTPPLPRVRHQPLELPPIPRLLGNENLDEWDDILVRTLRLHGLAEYVTLPYPGVPEPEPPTPSTHLTSWAPIKHLATAGHTTNNAGGPTAEQWARDRSLVCLIMVGSWSADVRDTLLAAGYDPSETNPKAIYDLVRDAVPKAAGEDVGSYLRELGSVSPAEPRFGGSLREYGLRLGCLRRRLYASEPQPNDNLVLVMAVLGLARDGRYEDLSMDLGRELERGGLTWARFMSDLAGVHGREVAERRKRRGKVAEGVA